MHFFINDKLMTMTWYYLFKNMFYVVAFMICLEKVEWWVSNWLQLINLNTRSKMVSALHYVDIFDIEKAFFFILCRFRLLPVIFNQILRIKKTNKINKCKKHQNKINDTPISEPTEKKDPNPNQFTIILPM